MVGYLPTFYIYWIFKNRQKPQTHNHRHLGELPRGLCGWLPTYILYKLDFQKPSKAADTQIFRCITQKEPLVATYLHFIISGFLKTVKSRGHTSTGILVHYSGAPWVATYLHFILTGFSKTAKSRGHTSTGILVNYPEVFLGSYLPSFHINWIFKNHQKPLTHKHRHFSQLPRGFLRWLPTYILY